MVDGQVTVGKSLGRAPLGGSNIRKRRQGGRMGNGGIAWGEPRWEGATRKRGSDDRVDGRETVGGKVRWKGATRKQNLELLARVFRTNYINAIVPKTVGPRLVKRCANTARWNMHNFVGREQG